MAEPMSGTLANVAIMKPTPALSATTDVPEAPPVSRETPPAAVPPASPDPADAPAAPASPDGYDRFLKPPAGLDAEAPAESDEGERVAPPSRPRTPFSERLSELARARNEAQERANRAEIALAEERARRAEEALEQTRQRPAATPLPEVPRPRRSEYADPDAYDDAIADWAEKRAEARAIAVTEAAQQRYQKERDDAERERQNSVAQQQHEQTVQVYHQRRAAFMRDHPDFAEVAEADDVPVTAAMAVAITRSENGPALAYYLGQHPEEARRIAALSDVSIQFLEMGQLAAKVTAPPRVQPSRAPRPITPINSSAAAVEKDIRDMTTNEYAEWRKKQDWAQEHRIPILPAR